MPMIDLAKTDAEVKEEKTSWDGPGEIAGMVDRYPWGLSISLDHDTLVKLGLDSSLPDVGTAVKFSAEARVTSVSSRQEEGDGGATKDCKRVELQIVRIAIGEDAPRPRSNWYGSAAPAAASGDA